MKLLKNLFKFEVLESTQDKAFELLKEYNEVIVIAERMTKGRGRYGNNWISDFGGLYMSIGFKNKSVDFSKKLLIITPVCILEILKDYGIEAQIKIPNDIYYNNKKICGILIEMKDNDVVLGIGLNVNQDEFPENLNATSMLLITKRYYNIEEIALKIYSNLKNLLDYEFREILKVYNENLIKKHYKFEYKDKVYNGKLLGINENYEVVFDIGNFDMFYLRNLEELF